MLGIENIKLVTVAIGAVSTGLGALIHNGVGFEDIPAVQAAAFALYDLKDCEYSQVKSEILDIDSTEQGVIAQLFADNFNIEAESKEEMIEKGCSFLMMSLPFLISVINQFKPKAPVVAG